MSLSNEAECSGVQCLKLTTRMMGAVKLLNGRLGKSTGCVGSNSKLQKLPSMNSIKCYVIQSLQYLLIQFQLCEQLFSGMFF